MAGFGTKNLRKKKFHLHDTEESLLKNSKYISCTSKEI